MARTKTTHRKEVTVPLPREARSSKRDDLRDGLASKRDDARSYAKLPPTAEVSDEEESGGGDDVAVASSAPTLKTPHDKDDDLSSSAPSKKLRKSKNEREMIDPVDDRHPQYSDIKNTWNHEMNNVFEKIGVCRKNIPQVIKS